MNEDDKKKIFMSRVVIGSIAFVILILWGFNLKNVWSDGRSKNESSAEWSNLKTELEKSLNEAQVKLNKIEADKAAVEKKTGDNFLAGLLEEAGKNASSSVANNSSSASIATTSPTNAATSTPNIGRTASSTKNINCPKYIDCMPTIGKAKPCVVPLGCEGITLIAY